jgi:hypothetical protein
MCNSNSDVQNFLNESIQGYDDLRNEVKIAIQNFSMIWSLFESKLLGCNASIPKIHNMVYVWETNNFF